MPEGPSPHRTSSSLLLSPSPPSSAVGDTTTTTTTTTRKRTRPKRPSPLDPTPNNFPCGPGHARKHVRLAFRNSRENDARTTITTFQLDNGLHSNLARAFGTVLRKEDDIEDDDDDDGEGGGRGEGRTAPGGGGGGGGSIVVEPLDPSPALDFLSRLGVTRREVHTRVASALRSAIEDEVQRLPVVSVHGVGGGGERKGGGGGGDDDDGARGTGGHPAMLDLLRSSWQFRDVPELRPVLICVLRRLGNRIPVPMLRRLGARKGDTAELRNAELVGQLGPHLQRLVWEADWDAAMESSLAEEVAADGGGEGGGGVVVPGTLTLGGTTILAVLIRPSVASYTNDPSLVRGANLAFVGTLAERRCATKLRRGVGVSGGAAGTAQSSGGSSTATEASGRVTMASIKSTMTSTVAAAARPMLTPTPLSAVAVASIRDVIGNRPKLLAAVLDMLIADHGGIDRGGDGTVANSIVGGATYLTCTLVADVLLSFGQLPRSYEVLDIMARTLDASVQSGIISDDAISQVQGCLRSIFRPARSSEQPEGTKIKLSLKPAAKATSTASASPDSPADDSGYERKLIQMVVKKALVSMKENDPQGLFLNPVTDAIAPGYYVIVETPMCIRTMEEKMMKSTYKGIDEFKDDALLIFSNCCKYNVGAAGQWFRTEAERQKKLWKDDIFPDAKSKLKAEMSKRRNILKGQTKPPPPLAFAPGKTENVPVVGGRKKEARDDRAINNLTAQDVKPLPPWKCNQRKTGSEVPSMQCLASMMLADPFVVRILLDKIVKILRVDVLKSKTVPSGHPLLPSMFQLLNIARISTNLCALNGKQCYVPDAGICKVAAGEGFSPSFESTRNLLPLFAKLLLDVELDRRMVQGGDLHDAALQNVLARPVVQVKEWKESSSLYDLRAVVESAFVHVVQPGNAHEVALQNQFPRFVAALDELSGGNMMIERPFFVSLSYALLRYKSKLPRSTRDLATGCLIRWLKMGGNISPNTAVCSPLHECFIFLLNEWSSFGNLVLSRDMILSLGEEAASASAGIDIGQKNETFVKIWASDDDGFSAVKEQYTRMLSSTPDARALQWKQKVGINTSVPSSPTADNIQE